MRTSNHNANEKVVLTSHTFFNQKKKLHIHLKMILNLQFYQKIVIFNAINSVFYYCIVSEKFVGLIKMMFVCWLVEVEKTELPTPFRWREVLLAPPLPSMQPHIWLAAASSPYFFLFTNLPLLFSVPVPS